jgi:hypothetical protein
MYSNQNGSEMPSLSRKSLSREVISVDYLLAESLEETLTPSMVSNHCSTKYIGAYRERKLAHPQKGVKRTNW